MPMTKPSKMQREKGGKGKKGSKHESKSEKEPDLETARANAALWELKLKSTEQDLSDYRGAHHNMARMNEQLINQLHRAQQDSVDMTGYWQRQVEAREEKVREGRCTHTLQTWNADLNSLKVHFLPSQINMLEDELRRQEALALQERNKQVSVNLLHNFKILLKMHGFLPLCLFDLFFPFSQMEKALKSALEEQDRLNEALKSTIQEAEDLKELTHSLAKEKLSLTLEKDMLELTIKKNSAKMEAKEKKLSEVTAKVSSLELALGEISRKLEQQEEREKTNLITIQASQVELEKLQKLLAMREKEMQRVKQLARTIVDKRKEVEEFFHEALDHVRQEIIASRIQYKKEALQDYQQKFREATAGMIKFPPISTVNKSPNSTNYLYADIEATVERSEVHVSHLTWKQKEKVLGLLFAKMNGQTER
uniref:Basal body orientation factor 1 n=1 Tax=Cyprinodon variegatus TaxID=28743 RepID=A0A3Q2DJ86_CYPVA